jgi:hypothetical protein
MGLDRNDDRSPRLVKPGVGVRKYMDIKIVQADIDDAHEILGLQKIAYQKEAVLYDDWTIPLKLKPFMRFRLILSTVSFLKQYGKTELSGPYGRYSIQALAR